MVESLFKRAKAFIGLEEEGEEERPFGGQQMEINSVLRTKRENKGEGGGIYSVMYYEPKVYEDSLNISTNLRIGSPVIINLRYLDPAEGTRLIDFVCGTAYAIDGHMMKIGDSIFLFTPNQIAINNADERTVVDEDLGSDENRRGSFFSR
jgi:cell division inhibitor SepF